MVQKTIFKGITLLLLLLCNGLQAQQVSVDQLTGSARVNFSLYNFSRGRISIPISLSYHGNGVKTKDVEGNAGMGWNLNAGGSISRELRDLPDDLADNNRGQLYNSNLAHIAAFNIANDNNYATCSDETADLNYMATYFAPLSDVEADIFNIDVPGLSCKLIFGANHQPRTIPYQDIKVSYTTNDYGINSFRVISDQGIVYDFEVAELAFRTSKSSNPSGISFFKDIYNKYSTTVPYYRKWLLTKISDDANVVGLTYTIINNVNKYSNNPYAFYIGNTGTKTTQFTMEEFGPNYVIAGIRHPLDDGISDHGAIGFGYRTNGSTGMSVISGVSTRDRSWYFDYDEAATDTLASSKYYRLFLSGITESGISTPISYQFSYVGLTGKNLKQIALPDSSSRELDRWGYYNASGNTSLVPSVYINPSNAGLDRFRSSYSAGLSSDYPYSVTGMARDPNLTAMQAGSLEKVTDIKGNQTRITYESNTYYDPQAGENVSGNGLRVRRLQTYELADTAKRHSISYTYLDPISGNSSGKPLGMPIYAFLRPYTGGGTTEQQWQASVVRSDDNLSPESNAIFYTNVKETIGGMGYKRYLFSVPAGHFDASAAPDWIPAVNNVAGCSGAGFLNNQKNAYPFVSNLDFSLQQGRLVKLEAYNENNEKVSENSYSYVRTGTSGYIASLRHSVNNGIDTYAKYHNLVDVGYQTISQTEVLYDIVNNLQQQQTVNYTYGSSNHQYPTKVETTNSDGSVNSSLSLYSKDYNLSVANEASVTALKQLVAKNVNIPIEKYTQLTKGGNTKTVAAELVKFGTFSPTIERDLYLPAQAFSFLDANGVSDFTVSGISGGYLSMDSRYIPNVSYLAYDFKGNLLSAKPAKGKVSSTLYSPHTLLPKANIVNAAHNEVVVEDFEDNWDLAKLLGVAPIDTLDSRSGNQGGSLGGSYEPVYNLVKKAGASYYLFSAWMKAEVAGNLEVTLTNGSTTSTYYLPYSNTGSFKYYQLKLPVGTFTGSLQLKLKSTPAIGIDDVLFYPFDAMVGTQTTDPIKLVKTSETGVNGVAKYYEYDSFNRLKHILDEDKNIVLKKSYVLASDFQEAAPKIYDNTGGQCFSNTSYNFFPAEALGDGDGNTYTWNFGDGSATVSSSGGNVPHSYAATGTYTITLTKNSPLYGTYAVTKMITVVDPPISPVRLLSAGGINISVYQGGVLLGYFSELELSAGNVVVGPGTYVFRISSFDAYSTSNPYGFQSVRYTAYEANYTNQTVGCINSEPGVNNYEMIVNITGKENITFNLAYGESCGSGGGIERRKKQ